jgi:O-antigen ligase
VSAVAAPVGRWQIVSSAVLLGSLAVLTFASFTGLPLSSVTLAVAVVVTVTVAYRELLAWRTLIALLLVVILFIPVRRYTLPGDLPFELEPYRIMVAFLMLGWVTSLLIDPRVRLRRSGFEAPLCLLVAAILGSVIVNAPRVTALSGDVAKTVTFFLSYLLVFFLIVSVVRSPRTLDILVTLLVLGGTVLAVSSVIESRSGYNVFNHLADVFPFLQQSELPRAQGRGERLRAYASAEHAIALSAALVMLIPLAVYLRRRTAHRRWSLVAALLAVGALAAVSRTGVVMLIVVGLVFLWLRPVETKRLWPVLVPALVVVHVALPATLGPLKSAFFPPGGLIAEQKASAGTYGSGRLADLGPSLDEAKRTPFLGQGFGTRITEWGRANAPILDNQWLGTLLETGAVGVFALGWLLLRPIRRLARRAKEDPSPRGWLAAGVAASLAAFGVGMFTYDAFAFVQVTFLLFILLAFAAVIIGSERANPSGSERRA